jgi:hypothetical protein
MTYNELAAFIMNEMPKNLRDKTVEVVLTTDEFGYELEAGTLDSFNIKYSPVAGVMDSPAVFMEFRP